MLVSTRWATVVEFLTRPTPVLGTFPGPHLSRPCLPLALASCRLVKKLEPFFNGFRIVSRRRIPLDYAYRITGRQPFQIVSRTNLIPVGDCLGKRELELARNLGHCGIITRK